jgi:hypothetical protein
MTALHPLDLDVSSEETNSASEPQPMEPAMLLTLSLSESLMLAETEPLKPPLSEFPTKEELTAEPPLFALATALNKDAKKPFTTSLLKALVMLLDTFPSTTSSTTNSKSKSLPLKEPFPTEDGGCSTSPSLLEALELRRASVLEALNLDGSKL